MEVVDWQFVSMAGVPSTRLKCSHITEMEMEITELPISYTWDVSLLFEAPARWPIT